MKFAETNFWKHRNVCCEFIEVVAIISDDGETAELRAALNEQLNNGYVTLVSNYNFRVSKKDYPKWQSYSPRGNKL